LLPRTAIALSDCYSPQSTTTPGFLGRSDFGLLPIKVNIA
jgi:hypothetical protein